MEYNEYSYPEQAAAARFMYGVYGWMAFALSITAGISYYIFKTQTLFKYLKTNPGLMVGLIVLQFALVIALAFFLMRMTLFMAITFFVVYAASIGVTMSSIFSVYTESSIAATFLVTAGMFGAMCLYGYFTKADLTAMGSFAIMGLFGLIIGLLVNLFLRSAGFDYLLSAFGVIIFTLLTAYDTQKIKRIGARLGVDSETRGKVAILGALTLYLDFLNLFLYLLRFMGQRREN